MDINQEVVRFCQLEEKREESEEEENSAYDVDENDWRSAFEKMRSYDVDISITGL